MSTGNKGVRERGNKAGSGASGTARLSPSFPRSLLSFRIKHLLALTAAVAGGLACWKGLSRLGGLYVAGMPLEPCIAPLAAYLIGGTACVWLVVWLVNEGFQAQSRK